MQRITLEGGDGFPEKIVKSGLKSAIELTKGKLFGVTFKKRTDGSLRRMVARIGVTKGRHGGSLSYDPEEKDLVIVYDFKKLAYRSIPLEGIRELRFKGKYIKVY